MRQYSAKETYNFVWSISYHICDIYVLLARGCVCVCVCMCVCVDADDLLAAALEFDTV